jgi:hypothetical protein
MIKWVIIVISVFSLSNFIPAFQTSFPKDTVISRDQFGEDDFELKSIFGRKEYIEYMPGNLPIVISAPHGGYNKSDEINDRTRSSLHQDKQTLELTLELQKQFLNATGRYPYVILNKLHRSELDPNREYEVAVQGDSIAGIAFREFHNFIETAEREVFEKWGTGFYVDVHAHPFKDRKIELGYLLEADLLFFSDEDLNDDLFIDKSSIKNLVRKSEYTIGELIRGEVSLGAMLEKKGYPAMPSPAKPEPKDQFFYSGGYNTTVHSSKKELNFNGVQIETYWDGLRDSPENIKKFSTVFVEVLIDYLKLHYKMDLTKLSD